MIFVFRTSVRNRMQVKKLKPHIDKLLPGSKWNFDLEDIDKILRIDSKEDIVRQTMALLNTHAFSCTELD